MAATAMVYVESSTSPVIVHGDAVQFEEETVELPEVGVAKIEYARIGEPPVSSGAAKFNVAAPVPAELERIRGADGTAAVTEKERVTLSAASKLVLPAWEAVMVHGPGATRWTIPPAATVHAAGVDEA